MSKNDIIVQGANIWSAVGYTLSKLARINLYDINNEADSKTNSMYEFNSLSSALEGLDFPHMKREDLITLGFLENQKNKKLLYVPVWIFAIIPDGVEFVYMDGSKAIKGIDKFDMYEKFGFLRYGFIREEK